MLWAVLAIGNWEREKALEFFRYVGGYVERNPECWDVTLSGIAKLLPEKRAEFIVYIANWEGAPLLLKAMLIFPDFPARAEWEAVLGKLDDNDTAAENIATSVMKVLWHQSQEATDCRWIKFLATILAKRVKFSSSIKGIDETLRGVWEYPNYGDLTHVRPFIRSGEIARVFDGEPDFTWANHFWETCFLETGCIPESGGKLPLFDAEAWDKEREHYLSETARARKSLITHCLKTASTSAVDYHHEGAFGLALYAQLLMDEIVLHRLNFTAAGRLSLRAIAEAYITLAYLLKKDDPSTWRAFREHGTGQAKLVHLKLDELKKTPKFLDRKTIEAIANEDAWQEFVSMNVGHWDDSNLRAMSEEAGLKEVYDQYYGWSSGYMHANWAAVRDTSYEKCFNPLHRLHRLPALGIKKLPDVLSDAVELTNEMLDLISVAYPTYPDRVAEYTESAVEAQKSSEPEVLPKDVAKQAENHADISKKESE